MRAQRKGVKTLLLVGVALAWLVSTAQQVRAGMFPLVSPGVVTLTDSQLGFTKGILVRDPDGHVMQLIAQ